MPTYKFGQIAVVPDSNGFIDIILSMTQRKTPTVIRKGYKISRIRSFYMRKVKFTQDNFCQRLALILETFPQVNDIHPFYGDMINVLYSKKHYKLALGQINATRQRIENIAKDFLRLMKFSDSMYRCQQLKRNALGRMCTVVKKINASLKYLEQVRMHLSRFPSIDPSKRTLIVSGYPNVGKSSFINSVSRANVEVEAYAFTTKSLYIGHTDYEYSRWQVIDTPGLLDHPFEDRNTIEMQSLVALAHLQATVMFFIDISETCGYSVEQQAKLFHNISDLFQNKPLLIVLTKTDIRHPDELNEEEKALIAGCTNNGKVKVMSLSNETMEGIDAVKKTACDMLLVKRYERKINSSRINNVMNQLNVSQPIKRDDVVRGSHVPQSVIDQREQVMNGIIAQPRVTMKDKERAYNDNGVELGFSFNLQEHWRLKNPEHAVDIVPQIMNGKNIADFIDPDIEERLAALQKEEDILFAEWVEQRQQDSEDSGLDDEQIETLKAIRAHKYKAQTDRNMKNTKNGLTARVPRKFRGYELKEAERKLQNRGLETDKMREEVMTLGKRRWQGRRRRAEKAAAERNWPGHSDEEDNEGGQDPFAMDSRMDTMSNRQKKKAKAARSQSVARREKNNPHARGNSKTPGPAPRDVAGIGEADIYKVQKLSAIGRKGWQKGISARSGPGDRRLMTGLAGVKHLFTGKRGIGSTDRR